MSERASERDRRSPELLKTATDGIDGGGGETRAEKQVECDQLSSRAVGTEEVMVMERLGTHWVGSVEMEEVERSDEVTNGVVNGGEQAASSPDQAFVW